METEENTSLVHIKEQLLQQDESIVWKGVPSFDFGMSDVQNSKSRGGGAGVYGSLAGFWGGGGDRVGGIRTAWIQLAIFPLIFATALFFSNGQVFWGISTIILALGVMVYPLFRQQKNRNETFYYITEKQLIFETRKRQKKIFNTLPLAKIARIVTDADDSNRGTIYFQTVDPADFYTYDFQTGKYRHVPTFELVPDVKEVGQLIRDLIDGSD